MNADWRQDARDFEVAARSWITGRTYRSRCTCKCHIYPGLMHIIACCRPDPQPHPSMNIQDIAQVAHEVNKAYCTSIGDDSQVEWADAPDWQKNSAVLGVEFHLNHPDATPENSHESWLKQKTEEGWKYGPVKNVETKEHPCFLPYADLPADNKAKDYLFTQVVNSLKKFLPVERKEEA